MLKELNLIVRPWTRRKGDAVDHMIRACHYLNRWPGTTVAVFRLESNTNPVGVIVYSLPPREIFKRYNVTLAWELSRLWVSDEMPRNTESWFIAQTVRWIRRNRPSVGALVSYADPSQGHVGTIYKASNWKADGRTDQERKTPRFDLVANGKRYGRASHVPNGQVVERLPRVSKYRFVMHLS